MTNTTAGPVSTRRGALPDATLKDKCPQMFINHRYLTAYNVFLVSFSFFLFKLYRLLELASAKSSGKNSVKELEECSLQHH